MCDLCGCNQYIKQGKKAVLSRAVAIIQELGITTQNVDDYEDTERISYLIAPFGSSNDNVYPTAAWVSGLHMGMPRLSRDKHYQAHVRAFRDIFSRLPVQGDPKHIATTYHQLEQLGRELNDADLASLDLATKETIQTVNHVHDEPEIKVTRLKQRYGL